MGGPSALPDDDYILRTSAVWKRPKSTTALLPRSVDLRAADGPISNQRKTRTCTGHAVSSAIEIIKPWLGDLSPLPIYWHARRLDPRTAERPAADTGVGLGYAVRAAINFGTCLENDMPFSKDVVGLPPTTELSYRLSGASRIELFDNEEEILWTLAHGLPVVLTVDITKAWYRYRSLLGATCRLTPLSADLREPVVDSHAICLVGYHMGKDVLYFRNSWGTRWGRRGYGELRMSALTSGRVRDIWVCQ